MVPWHGRFRFPLYLRIWLAVVAAVTVLTIAFSWLWRLNAEQNQIPEREVVIRNETGEILGQVVARPTRVPGPGPGVPGGDERRQQPGPAVSAAAAPALAMRSPGRALVPRFHRPALDRGHRRAGGGHWRLSDRPPAHPAPGRPSAGRGALGRGRLVGSHPGEWIGRAGVPGAALQSRGRARRNPAQVAQIAVGERVARAALAAGAHPDGRGADRPGGVARFPVGDPAQYRRAGPAHRRDPAGQPAGRKGKRHRHGRNAGLHRAGGRGMRARRRRPGAQPRRPAADRARRGQAAAPGDPQPAGKRAALQQRPGVWSSWLARAIWR